MITVAAHSDKTGERRWHVARAAVPEAGLAIRRSRTRRSGVCGARVRRNRLYSNATAWSLPTAFLRGDGARRHQAINSVGNLGGFVGPYLMGWMQRGPGDFRGGLLALALSAFCSGLIVLTVRSRGRHQAHSDA
jgi:ACS family tartrate transporter-like MFS transporter